MKNQIKHSEFQLKNYVTKSNRFGQRVFDFKDDRIDKLPFVTERVLELRDSYFPEKGENLILRITPTQKTFYVKTKNKPLKKIGVWKKRTDSRHYEKGTLSTAKARELAVEHFELVKYTTLDETAIANMTIREYLDSGQYLKDRSKIKIQSNKIKPLELKTIKTIRHGARTILDYKICEISNEWLDLLRDDWNAEYISKGNNQETKKTKDTQRRYFTMINAMFGIWDTAGYIRKNPFTNIVNEFHDASKSMTKIQVNTIDEVSTSELVDFIIDELPEHTPRKMHGKIVLATMALAGVRNCEVYRNYYYNWDFVNRKIIIPGEIIKKTNDTRYIPIENDRYWKLMRRYFAMGGEFFYKTKNEFLLPNSNAKSGHALENCTSGLWDKVRVRFNIPAYKRAYDLRHTFANNLRKEIPDVQRISQYLGDNVETVVNFYFKKDFEAGRDAIRKIHKPQVTETLAVNQSEDLLVDVEENSMPSAILRLFSMYKSGKIIDGKMRLTDYTKFLQLLNSLPDQTADPESKFWLQIQAA